MEKYPGLQEHVGPNGCYRLNRQGDDFNLDIYLLSVPSFVEEHGKWLLSDPARRDYPDITFVIDNDEGYWSIVSMEVPSFGMDGVNEFLLALMQHQESLNQIDELLPIIKSLLDQQETPWGKAPLDLEAQVGAYKLNDPAPRLSRI